MSVPSSEEVSGQEHMQESVGNTTADVSGRIRSELIMIVPSNSCIGINVLYAKTDPWNWPIPLRE